MTAVQVRIRDLVHDAIKTALDAGSYTQNFNLGKTYFPRVNLENITEYPQVWVVATGFSTSRERLLRDRSSRMELPVQVCLQQRLADPAQTTYIDEQLITLFEELIDTCEADFKVTGFKASWLRTDPLRDPNDLIYSYEDLLSSGVFHAIFTAHYRYLNDLS